MRKKHTDQPNFDWPASRKREEKTVKRWLFRGNK